MTARRRPEQIIQRSVFQHFAIRCAPGVFVFHPANGGYRTRIEGAILRGLGVVPGVPDIIAIKAGGAYGLELKAEGGRVSNAQAETIHAMERAGATVSVAVGLDAALRQLEAWGLLRGSRT